MSRTGGFCTGDDGRVQITLSELPLCKIVEHFKRLGVNTSRDAARNSSERGKSPPGPENGGDFVKLEGDQIRNSPALWKSCASST